MTPDHPLPPNIARRSAEMAVPLYEHMHMHMAAQAGGAQAQEEQCLVELYKKSESKL